MGHVGLSAIWLLLALVFIAGCWLCVVVFNLEEWLIGGILGMTLLGFITWAGVIGVIQSRLPDRKLELSGSQLRYRGAVIDLQQWHEVRVEANGMTTQLQLDIAQGDVTLSFLMHHIDRSDVTDVYPDAALAISASLPDCYLVPHEPLSRVLWPHVKLILQAMHTHRAAAQPWARALPSRPHAVTSLVVGVICIPLIFAIVTLVACFAWMPKLACLFFSPVIAGVVWSLVWPKLDRVAWLAALLCQAMCGAGIYYTSDWMVWEFGDPIDVASLYDGGSFRANRARRIKGLVVRPEWGTPWLSERDGGDLWLFGTAAMTAPETKQTKRVRLWAICEQKGSVATGSKEFLGVLRSSCRGEWNGTVAMPVPWGHWETYKKLVVLGAKQVKLRRSDDARIVYLMRPRDVDWQKDMRVTLNVLVAGAISWIFGAIACLLWFWRRDVKTAAATTRP
jgi:hypothetical protein